MNKSSKNHSQIDPKPVVNIESFEINEVEVDDVVDSIDNHVTSDMSNNARVCVYDLFIPYNFQNCSMIEFLFFFKVSRLINKAKEEKSSQKKEKSNGERRRHWK